MKNYLYVLVFTLVSSGAFAQKITIKGALRDSANRPLEGATIMLLDGKDTSLVSFARSQSLGLFEFKNLANEAYFLKATYVGLQPVQQTITPSKTELVDLGVIKMLPVSKDLNEVVVKGERDPVKIKQDTIEYNAGSFKVQPNAVVEDLLKRLPGVEVDRDGTVKAQGQQVRRVMVDGKEARRYMRALPTQELCLSCHGPVDRMKPAVVEKLKILYPDDKGTGYAVGQIRGAMTIRKAL